MKKRLLSAIVSLCLLLTMAPTVAFAADGDYEAANTISLADATETSGTCGAEGSESSVTWKLTQNNEDNENPTYTLTISGSGAMADFTLPTKPNDAGANVAPWYTALPADENTSSVPITEIKIDEGVTYLGNYAFSCLTNVVKANIPASITRLGNYIFRGDTALTTVEWASGFNAPEITDTDSNSATYTGNYVPTSMFDGCTSLGKDKELSAWLPASFTGVGCAAFRGTQFTVNFDGWKALNYIGAYGFAGMPNLDSFTLSNEITLGLRGGASNAFNSSGLKSLTVADGIAAIPSGLCNGCEQLSSVALADSVTTIATNAFFNTKALEKIDLKNVQTINSYAFWGSGLTDLVLPKSVEKVENRVFEACTSLMKVTINAENLTLDNNNTFAGCSSLNTVVTSATSNINELINSAFGPDTSYGSKDYKQAPVESIEINGTVNTLNFSTLSSLKSLTINGKNTWVGNVLPSGFENLVINGDSWSVGGYQFQSSAPVKHLTVFANQVSAADKSEAAFRSNSNLETAQFTGKTVKLQDKMFLGCTKLNWLDLSTVDTLTVGSSCFGDDTSSSYGASLEKPNKFNEDCVIYAKDATAAQMLRTNLGTKGIVLVVNGGTVNFSKTGLAAVSKAGYVLTWTSSNGTPVPATDFKAGSTYYAKWTEKTTPAIAIKATPDTLTGGGSVELTVSGVPTEGLLAVTCDNDIKVTEKDGKYTAALPNETKDYTFKADYTGTDLYNNASDTCVVSVTYKGSSHHSSSSSSSSTSNTVSASTASNGKVSLDKSTAKKGDTVTVTVTPDAGYQLDKLTVTDAKGNTVEVTDKGNGKFSFVMPEGKVTVTPTFVADNGGQTESKSFSDVKTGDWYVDAVKYVSDKGLMSGTGSDKFAPSATTTRAMLMTVLARYAGEDTTGGATWYEKGMEWAKAKGVSDGTNPNANITREQLVTMMYRYAGSPKADGKLDSFSDAASVSTYAADAMQWAVANGIVNGSNGKLNPQNNATRAEVAAILMRFCEMSK